MADCVKSSPQTGRVPFGKYETWYMVFGDLSSSDHLPLVVVHGGPGAGHDYLEDVGELHQLTGRPVLLYDQVGCGRSTHLRDARDEICLDLFVRELENLVAVLNLTRYDLFGHSWGGHMAMEFALRKPPGLRKLVLQGSTPSTALGKKMRAKCYDAMPARLRAAVYDHFENGGDTPEYKEATHLYLKTHTCRVDPWPPRFLTIFRNLGEDRTVDEVMSGTRGVFNTGVMQSWSVLDRLPGITNSVLVPYGDYDFNGGEALQALLDGLPNVRTVFFPGCSHMIHFEAKDKFLACIAEFLNE